MDENELIDILSKPQDIGSYEELKNTLSVYINNLIINDFQKLVAILYRIDIDEEKLKKLLKNSGDAGEIIAKAIIERQLQKIETRKQFRS